MVHVTVHFLPNARMHGYGNRRPTDTGVGVQNKWLFTFNGIIDGHLTERVHTTLELLSRVLVHTCKWHLRAYLLTKLAHYITTSFHDEGIPQREMSIHLTLSATKEKQVCSLYEWKDRMILAGQHQQLLFFLSPKDHVLRNLHSEKRQQGVRINTWKSWVTILPDVILKTFLRRWSISW